MQLRLATCRLLPEPDPDEELLLAALRARGIEARMAAWNDPAEDWDERVPTVIRSTWDYIHDLERFLAWCERAARAGALFNPPGIVRANAHKRYLSELAARGVPVVPTLCLARGSRPALATLARERDWERVIVKPAVGASSFGTRRFSGAELAAGERHLAGLLARGDALVQPYFDSVEGYGERALVWIDGEFTHAVRKTPRFADEAERVSEALPIAADELAAARAALAPWAAELLYARVDLARDAQGRPCVMELELIEPSLFLLQHPPALARLVAGIERRLQG